MYKILFKSILSFFFNTLPGKDSSQDSLNILHKRIHEYLEQKKEEKKKKEYN